MAVPAPIDTSPVAEINTTPLIDVLLVLLVMLIITMPPQSHAVKLDLPNAPPDVAIDPIKNKVVVTTDDRILWNGAPVSRAQLKRALAATLRLPRPAELQLQPDSGARYALVDEVLVLTKQASVSRMGFVGNERYAHF
jgi:biopolymer transport protein ExbD